MDQLALFRPEEHTSATGEEVAQLRRFLAKAEHWQSRTEIAQALNLDIRTVRDAAEALGPEVVRGQAGYRLVDRCTPDDKAMVEQAIRAALSQGRKMRLYGLGLKKLALKYSLIH